MKKVMLVLVDGLRPDALEKCGHPFVHTLKSQSLYTMSAQTVMPSVTLPCHMSLFHSVPPDRHGVVTNLYTPQVRPVKGLCEVLRAADKTSGFYYTWHELRDLTRPDSLAQSVLLNLHIYKDSDTLITDACIKSVTKHPSDFVFLYLGETDSAGHNSGWMSDAQLKTVYNAVDCIQRVYQEFSKDYTFIVTSDHGGYGRAHGRDIPEDRTIPIFITNSNGNLPKDTSIMDIAPTIVKLLGVCGDADWEGKPLI